MSTNLLAILLRIFIVSATWISVWRFIEPKTPARRLLRAAVLALALLTVSYLMDIGR